MDIIRQMFIPPLGTVIKLSCPWTFNLHRESRNWSMLEHFSLPTGYYDPKVQLVTIPFGAELKIDRIYIKKSAPSYNSVTFSWLKHSIPLKRNLRFWAKLDEVNKIEFIIKE